MRLFLAIEPTDTARAALAATVDRLRREVGPAAGALRWVGAMELHVTLHFLGELRGESLRRLRDALSPPLEQRVFELAIGAAGVYPPTGPPRVLWLGLERGDAEAQALHAALATRIVAAGVPVESRRFSPHLTVARVRDRERSAVRDLRSHLAGRRIADVAWRVTQVALVESQLGSGGARYRTEMVLPLRGGTAPL